MQEEVSSHPYIIRDERISGGSAVIKGTRTRVVDIAIEYEYQVHSPDEIISAHPLSRSNKYTMPCPITMRIERR